MLAFITLTVFGPYALKLMFGIFCSMISIACSLCGIGLKIVPLLVLATVLQKSYKSIRGDKDKDKDNNETPKQGPMNTGAEAEVKVPNFPAIAKVFSNDSCALW
jgi:hypothetical protein